MEIGLASLRDFITVFLLKTSKMFNFVWLIPVTSKITKFEVNGVHVHRPWLTCVRQ